MAKFSEPSATDLPGLRAWLRKAGGYFRARPTTAIIAVSVASVLASAYPIVFGGRSFVSRDNGETLLYSEFPTLPGYDSAGPLDSRGSDVGAIIWQHVPY